MIMLRIVTEQQHKRVIVSFLSFTVETDGPVLEEEISRCQLRFKTAALLEMAFLSGETMKQLVVNVSLAN